MENSYLVDLIGQRELNAMIPKLRYYSYIKQYVRTFWCKPTIYYAYRFSWSGYAQGTMGSSFLCSALSRVLVGLKVWGLELSEGCSHAGLFVDPGCHLSLKLQLMTGTSVCHFSMSLGFHLPW